MAVYALVELAITNRDGLMPYVEAVKATITAHGGRYLVRGGDPEVVEGSLGAFPRKVILEFPSMEAAKGWYDSEEYQAILPLRTANSRCNFIWLQGV
jgi:uncharacterized protein (DUF1330 family)